ncbi:polysaccharide deacetylase family protein [uncultured Alcanivorax sp.]|uniref:polysaccharide deacetylase family protein n=1 Tax=uncultured Alcanivorax sp. TaxID=191215 RepID=UPI002610E4B1|nr:polysaccharide deacetylase family protein [uncultured Alcanivorax sp.]
MPAAPSESLVAPRALVSIHDVMPETREQVSRILALLPQSPQAVTLLVVPGRNWQTADLDWLHQLQQQGYPLAGHGWLHRCDPPISLYHRVHSLLLSRRVAEHLSLSASGIDALIRNCHQWFLDQGLQPCELYVPPAWAMGAINRQQLADMPFRLFETLSGVYDAQAQKMHPLPLVGFEADTPLREWLLRGFNHLNWRRASHSDQPLRIGIHPQDLSLRLRNQVIPMAQSVSASLTYGDAVDLQRDPRLL